MLIVLKAFLSLLNVAKYLMYYMTLHNGCGRIFVICWIPKTHIVNPPFDWNIYNVNQKSCCTISVSKIRFSICLTSRYTQVLTNYMNYTLMYKILHVVTCCTPYYILKVGVYLLGWPCVMFQQFACIYPCPSIC